MVGIGTIINTAAIIVGGLCGALIGSHIREQLQDSLIKACGVSTLFLGIAGAMEGMLSIADGTVSSGRSMLVVLCIVFGAVIGELIDIERWFERFGEWLKIKSGNAKDGGFVDAFVTASFTVCIGAMAIVGSIQDGIYGDYSILATKAILDFIIILIMTSAMGKGCVFSAIPVAVLQGTMTALSKLIRPIMTPSALVNLSLVGSILIFCVGLNLVWGKKIKVANFLPAIVLAVIFAFLPVSL